MFAPDINNEISAWLQRRLETIGQTVPVRDRSAAAEEARDKARQMRKEVERENACRQTYSASERRN